MEPYERYLGTRLGPPEALDPSGDTLDPFWKDHLILNLDEALAQVGVLSSMKHHRLREPLDSQALEEPLEMILQNLETYLGKRKGGEGLSNPGA